MSPGDRRPLPAWSIWRPCAWRSRAALIVPTIGRPSWLGPLLKLGMSPADAHPVTRRIRQRRLRSGLRFGVLARDRLVLPKQSAEPGTAGEPFEATAARSLGLCLRSRMRRRASGPACDRAPLLRFFPLQHTLAAPRCPRQDPADDRQDLSQPPDDPASTFASVAPAHLRTSRRPAALAVLRSQKRGGGARNRRTHARGAFQLNPSPAAFATMAARRPVARISFVFDRACGPSR
jgi:hypothetical protein